MILIVGLRPTARPPAGLLLGVSARLFWRRLRRAGRRKSPASLQLAAAGAGRRPRMIRGNSAPHRELPTRVRTEVGGRNHPILRRKRPRGCRGPGQGAPAGGADGERSLRDDAGSTHAETHSKHLPNRVASNPSKHLPKHEARLRKKKTASSEAEDPAPKQDQQAPQ